MSGDSSNVSCRACFRLSGRFLRYTLQGHEYRRVQPESLIEREYVANGTLI